MTHRVIAAQDSTTPTPEETFALVFGEGADMVYAPDRTGLVEALIDGYADVAAGADGDAEALGMRYDVAQALAQNVRESIFASLEEQGKTSREQYTEAELNILWPHGSFEAAPPFEGEWTDVVPLVLIRTDYAPFSAYEVPSGNVLFIDPSNETAFLESLEALGLFKVLVREG